MRRLTTAGAQDDAIIDRYDFRFAPVYCVPCDQPSEAGQQTREARGECIFNKVTPPWSETIVYPFVIKIGTSNFSSRLGHVIMSMKQLLQALPAFFRGL